jgi:hypothetical protein
MHFNERSSCICDTVDLNMQCSRHRCCPHLPTTENTGIRRLSMLLMLSPLQTASTTTHNPIPFQFSSADEDDHTCPCTQLRSCVVALRILMATVTIQSACRRTRHAACSFPRHSKVAVIIQQRTRTHASSHQAPASFTRHLRVTK